jgi:hypothetical protein
MQKQAKKLFSHRSKKNFASVLLHVASKRKLRQFSLLFRLVFASFHFGFASDLHVSHRCKKIEKSFFLHQSIQNFASVSRQSENDGTPYLDLGPIQSTVDQ